MTSYPIRSIYNCLTLEYMDRLYKEIGTEGAVVAIAKRYDTSLDIVLEYRFNLLKSGEPTQVQVYIEPKWNKISLKIVSIRNNTAGQF